jgi:hypothetical protein
LHLSDLFAVAPTRVCLFLQVNTTLTAFDISDNDRIGAEGEAALLAALQVRQAACV